MNPITIPNISIPTIGIPTIGIPSVGFPSASGGGGLVWPVGMKEHIKAIYDPKKQGMTSFDVIESYAEDFTTWRYLDSRGTAAVTPNKITITESFDTTNIVEDVEEPYSDISIYVTGVSEDVPLVVRDITGNKAIITKDGKYDFSKNSRFMGFAIYKILSNINVVISLLPTSILKDLSGNGNHAYLYGGKGKLNSGMGVYQEDFSINTWNKTSFVFDYSHDYIKAKFKTINAGHRNVIVSNSNVSLNSMKIKVIIKGNSKDNRIMYSYADENGAQKVYYINNGETGIVPKSIATKTNDFLVGFRYNENNGDDCEITITQIPDYPDQLCYDGKMYAVCYGFPILTDYTVMADRTWFDNEGNRVFITKGNIWPNCAFNFEKVNASLSSETFSYSQSTNIDDLIGKSGITYQTKQSYNGKIIGVGTSSDGDILLIGGQLKGEYIGCHGKIIIADRSFTEDEITWLKDNWKKI